MMKLLGLTFALLIILMSDFLVVIASWQLNNFGRRNQSNLKNRYTRAVECRVSALYIKDCGIQVSRLGKEKIHAAYEKTCNLKDISFTFYFGKEGSYSLTKEVRTPVLTIPDIKNELEKQNKKIATGTHYIYLTMDAKSLKNVELGRTSDHCTFYVKPENATPNIGRLHRTAEAGVKFIVDASKSVNNDLGKANVELQYRWKCTDNLGYCKNRNLGTDKRVVVLAEDAVEGLKIRFTVGVRTALTLWQEATQIIDVDSSKPFAINCIAKCSVDPDSWNPNVSPVLFAECNFRCKEYPRNKVDGALYLGDKKLQTWKNFGVHPHQQSLNKLEPGQTLTMIANSADNPDIILGRVDYTILEPPKLSNCRSIPAKGTPLTKFKMQCDYEKQQVKNFEIEVKDGNTVVFRTSSSNLDKIEYMVKSNATVVVRLEDIKEVKIEQRVNVEVDPIFPESHPSVEKGKEALLKIYDGKTVGVTSVNDLIAKGDSKTAVQVIDLLAREMLAVEIKTQDDKNTIKELKTRLLTDLGRLSITDADMSKSVSGVISIIASEHKDVVSDSSMAALLTSTCKKVAEGELEMAENNFENEIQLNDVTDITNNLMNCAESEMEPDDTIFDELVNEVEASTKFPININLSENSFEDYPMYVADDIIETKINDFLDSGQNVIDICRAMGRSLLQTISVYDIEPAIISRDMTFVQAIKLEAAQAAETKFEQLGVTVIPSPSIARLDTVVSIRLCLFKEDPFWAISKTVKVPTSVMDISIMDEAEQEPITTFDKPMNITFEVENKVIRTKFTVGHVTNFDRYVPQPEDNFTIYSIKVKSQESFMIDFYDLSDSDQLEILIVAMRRPTIADFSNPQYVNRNYSKMFIQHPNKYDEWFLMGIRPRPNVELQAPIRINFTVYTPRCMRWDETEKIWKFACSINITTTTDKIHCSCFHLSVLAGFIDYNGVKQQPKFIDLHFHLLDRGSLLIVGIVCLVLALYFFLLVYAVHGYGTAEDAVYFMSDVPAQNRFGYLISIKTGGKINAGTTSDVMIQLFGSHGYSQKHVINYPDPLLELLQRSQEDFFVLGTPLHLGKLKKIELWFDCTGFSPSWYCDKIRICDLQMKEWYTFHVRQWLTISGKPRIFLKIFGFSDKDKTEEDSEKKIRLLESFLNFGRGINTTWQLSTQSDNPNFSYVKRLTVILSAVLTIMVVMLSFYGKPEFLPRDTITPDCFYELDRHTIRVVLLTILVTYVPHLTIMELFKRSRILYQKKQSKGDELLPAAVTLILWLILVTNVIVQTHLLLIYGYRIIYPTSWQWATSTVIALVFYILFLDYLYNIFLIVMGKALKTRKLDLKKVLRTVEIQRKYLYHFVGHYLYRPVLTPLYGLMTRSEYKRKRRDFKLRTEAVWQIQDLFMIIAFMVCLYVIVTSKKDSTYEISGHKEAVKLINGYKSSRIKLDDVTQMAGFEEYMEYTFIAGIQSYQWYGKFVTNDPGMTGDFHNRYLGIVRLRQHRAEPDTCEVMHLMRFVKRNCTSSSYFFQYDYLNYTPAWQDSIPEFHASRLGSIWGHQDGKGNYHFGVAGYYKTGGYIALLGRIPHNSYVNFDYIKRLSWLGPLTRAVIVEVPIFNMNKNIFHFVEMIVEKTPSGYLHKTVNIKTESVEIHHSVGSTTYIICSLLFLIIVGILCLRTIIRIVKTKIKYKRDWWHLMDIGISVLSLTWIYLYFKKQSLLKAFTKELEEKQSNVFIEYFSMVHAEMLVTILSGILIGAATLRVWKLLRFAAIFRTVERTLVYSFPSLIFMLIFYSLCNIAFGMMAFIAFGTKVEQFKDYFSTMKSLILITTGILNVSDFDYAENEHGLGYIFIILFYIFKLLNNTIFISIIIVEYTKAQEFSFEETLGYTMKDYTKEKIHTSKLLSQIWLRKFRLQAGGKQKEDEMITPKTNDNRYMHCVHTSSNRMQTMASIATCVLLKRLKKRRIDESDHVLMLQTLKHLCNKDEGQKEIFFTEGSKDSGVMFVDDQRIIEIERIVRRMLESPEQKAQRLRKEHTQLFILRENTALMQKINNELRSILDVVERIRIFIEDL